MWVTMGEKSNPASFRLPSRILVVFVCFTVYAAIGPDQPHQN